MNQLIYQNKALEIMLEKLKSSSLVPTDVADENESNISSNNCIYESGVRVYSTRKRVLKRR